MKTIEQRVTFIEQILGIPPEPTSLPLPVKDAFPVMEYVNTDIIISPYSPVIYSNNKYEMFYLWNGVKVFSKSVTGEGGLFAWYHEENGKKYPINWISGLSESIIKVANTYYSSGHYWSAGICYSNFSKSTDGINWVTVSANPSPMVSGEDRSLYHDGTKFYCYIRPDGRARPRAIGVMTSTDFVNWSAITTILTPTNPLEEYYSMSVFKGGNDWFGLLNVLTVDALHLDVGQLPPYAPNDNTVSVKLLYSANGLNWSFCNGGADFIPRSGGIKQCYALPTVVSDKLSVYTFETTRHHTTYEEANKNGRFFKIERYEISLTELLKYKPL